MILYTIPFAPEYQASRTGEIIGKFGKILKPNIKNGYAYVSLNQKSYRVHRIIATLFIPNPDKLPMVNHKDHNRLNNNVDNLEWCTQEYNTRYSAHLISASLKGIKKSKETKAKISATQQKRFQNRELPLYIYRYRQGYRFQIVKEGKMLAGKNFKTFEEAIKYKAKWFARRGIL